MDIKRKIEIVEQAVRSISQHSDEDAALLKAALGRVTEMVDAEVTALDARVAADIEAKLKGNP